MIILEWLRFIIGGGLLLAGLATFIIELVGVFRFRYVLNRMHAAAIGDTLGIGFALSGLIVMSGLNFTSLKLFLVIVFLWFSSPVSSHLVARLEITTNEDEEKHYQEMNLDTPEEELEAEKKDDSI
ncbi:monovalent cation/H(+) antiporter subunit G [Acetatifactor muris]|uniref:Putative monovalent cation/H+ antiporter subunit G n=1 Tax=Acetatifactor muris TaxID=879566 RepID=A0A2K4ZB70_9FIRM|nr:monovalent cation/H(+) antiporter subunit G [Acetatifactor muris]MCR2046181.1 monovalent cation/H(+) antiporter subunit G [Acetatifactor muris]SOY27712.1 putative monovalent cation/H+ antiporter subunit G [Acetatifactor muris]